MSGESETVRRFERHRERDPMAIERILTFARSKQKEGATDLVLRNFAGELKIDAAVLPRYAELAVERDPSLATVLRVRPFKSKPLRKSKIPSGTGYHAMWPIRSIAAATNLAIEGNHAGRLAHDAEDAADAGDLNWFRRTRQLVHETLALLAEYERILTDEDYRREVASR